MIATIRHCLAVFFTMVVLAGGEARAQDVVLSEVRADAGERWIELHNRSGSAVDLSSWSLYYASKTPNLPRTYWWPFPTNTVLAPDAFLRVHWFQTGVNVPGAVELWTGTSPYGFLFGLGGEPLLAARGALALFRSQSNGEMNNPAMVADWVSWGEHDFQRESLAISAGLWATGRHVVAIPTGSSIARDESTVGTLAYPDLEWFVDASPTPGTTNATGAILQSLGQPCALPGHHLLGAPALGASSQPLLGNGAFALSIANTTGIPGEFALLAWSAGAVPPGTPSILPPFSGVACQHEIDLALLVTTWLLPTQLLGTTFPLSLANLPTSLLGTELYAQGLVLDLMPNAWPPFQGTTNGLRLVIGQ